MKANDETQMPNDEGSSNAEIRTTLPWLTTMLSSFVIRHSSFVLLVAVLVLGTTTSPAVSFVYETPTEFLTAGDFNGDGIPDFLVLDKLTGNARICLHDAAHHLIWSAPLVTGVPGPDAVTIGRFFQSDRDALAITSHELNRINLLDLSGSSGGPTNVILVQRGLGPNLVAGVSPASGSRDWLVVGSADNNPSPGLVLLEMWTNPTNGSTAYPASNAQPALLEHGNALQLASNMVAFAALRRGSNDQLMAWQFVTNVPAFPFRLLLSGSNLAPGSDYVFGQFNNETLPRFIFYVRGQSNIVVQSLLATNGGYVFGTSVTNTMAEAVQAVYYVSQGSDGYAVVQFGDGAQGLRLPGGVATLGSIYRSGVGQAGNVIMGVVPLGSGNFALLDAALGTASSTHVQVVHFDGSSYAMLSASELPALATRDTRANVWLFQNEPFVSDDPRFIASVNAPDWSSQVGGLPSSLSFATETDGGTNAGLGNRVFRLNGSPPPWANYGIGDQYRDDISLFTIGGPRAAEAINLAIAPPPGLYDGPIRVSLTNLSGTEPVLYRLSALESYRAYAGPFAVTNDLTVQYYATNLSGARSRLLSANYSFEVQGFGPPQPTLDINPGATNPTPVFRSNEVVLSSIGTVFYGRRAAAGGEGTIWSINLDGNNETYITTGARPRVSRDGEWMAFLRDGTLWGRNLAGGEEFTLLAPGRKGWSVLTTNDAPPAGEFPSAVWTGTEMIIWGGDGPGFNSGDLNLGWRYNPATDRWWPISTNGAPSSRTSHSAIWTGTEMVIWGGSHYDYSNGSFTIPNNGGRYNPVTDSWRPISTNNAPVGRYYGHSVVWTGHEMIIWGGAVQVVGPGGSYSTATNGGGRYDPVADTWTPTTLIGAPTAREGHSAVWTGNEMIIFGGGNSGEALGVRYNPVSDTWTALQETGAPSQRWFPLATWTGNEMLIWGGVYYTNLNDGARYNPTTQTWAPITTNGAPKGRNSDVSSGATFWTGREMLIWGGVYYVSSDWIATNDGALYDPVADHWTPIPTNGAPHSRVAHAKVWTGNELIVWGGENGESLIVADGGRYGLADGKIVGYDWDLTETHLITDWNDSFWRIGLDGTASQLPLAAALNQSAPVVNPVEGLVAFQILPPTDAGLYLAPSNVASRQLLLNYPAAPRWPAWSPDGEELVFVDGDITDSVDSGKNLWVRDVGMGMTNLSQITAFTDPASGFPHGAIWSPEGEALVGAARLYGTNGIWIIPLNFDCMCSDDLPFRLPTSAGGDIDFVGSIVAAMEPRNIVQPGLFVQLDSAAVTVYWGSAFTSWTLESTTSLAPLAIWTPIPPPYESAGSFFIYNEARGALSPQKFFRLRYSP